MLGNSSIIAILFRLINFAIFIGLGVFYFRRSVFAKIKQKMLDEQEEKQSLVIRIHDLTVEFHTLDQSLQEQNRLCRSLENKVILWRSRVDEERYALEREKQNIYKRVQARVVRQENEQLFASALATIAPQSIEQVKKRLVDTFIEEGRGTEYIDAIVAHLDQEYRS